MKHIKSGFLTLNNNVRAITKMQFILVVILVIVAGVIGYYAGVWTAPKPPMLKEITIAYGAQTLSWGLTYVAKEKGIFEKYGLDARVIFLAGDTVVMPAVIAGSVDVGIGGLPIVASTRLKGEDVICIGITNYVPKGTGVWARPEIKSVQDLKGKVIAVPSIGGHIHSITRAALRILGVNPDEVKFIKMTYAEAYAALKEGKLDASYVSNDYYLLCQRAGFNKLFEYGDIPELRRVIWGTYYAKRSWVEANKGTVVAFLKAIIEAVDVFKDMPEDEFLPISEKYVGITDLEAIRVAVKNYGATFAKDIRVVVSDAKYFIDMLTEFVPEYKDLDVNRMIENTYVEQAMKELGVT